MIFLIQLILIKKIILIPLFIKNYKNEISKSRSIGNLSEGT